MNGVISELDMLTGSWKVSLQDDIESLNSTGFDHEARCVDRIATRTAAKIVDPVIELPNNPYAIALAQAVTITFTAKAEIDAEGNVTMLYISDCQARARAGAHD